MPDVENMKRILKAMEEAPKSMEEVRKDAIKQLRGATELDQTLEKVLETIAKDEIESLKIMSEKILAETTSTVQKLEDELKKVMEGAARS